MKNELHLFTVPDYYPDFHCKCASCRNSCCKGWTISMSMADYFRLIGLDCSKDIRHRLDCSLKLLDHPMPERYAELASDWQGNCPLHVNELCALQLECGEDVLSTACRYYPRGIRSHYAYECCCSGSCEAVIEPFLTRTSKIQFIALPLSFNLELAAPYSSEKCVEYTKKRTQIFRIMQNRRCHLWTRLLKVGKYLCNEQASVERNSFYRAVREILVQFGEHSISAGAYCTSAAEVLHIADGEAAFFTAVGSLQKRFRAFFPNWETIYEHVLINFIFYESFPYSERHTDLIAESNALFALYLLLYYTSIGCIKDSSPAALTDLICAVLRFAEHSNFIDMLKQDSMLSLFV